MEIFSTKTGSSPYAKDTGNSRGTFERKRHSVLARQNENYQMITLDEQGTHVRLPGRTHDVEARLGSIAKDGGAGAISKETRVSVTYSDGEKNSLGRANTVSKSGSEEELRQHPWS